jgi:hypothetical protein
MHGWLESTRDLPSMVDSSLAERFRHSLEEQQIFQMSPGRVLWIETSQLGWQFISGVERALLDGAWESLIDRILCDLFDTCRISDEYITGYDVF